MNKIINFDSLPDNYTSNMIDSGVNGSCFLIDNNKVFKSINNSNLFEDTISKLTNVNVPSFIFPEKLVYVDNKFVGYIMDYANGVVLYEVRDVPLDTYLKHMKLFEYNIAALSLKHIRIVDLNMGNILYDDNSGFSVIDTDFYVKDYDNDVYQNNISCFSKCVFESIFNIYFDHFVKRDFDNKLQLLIDGKYLPSKLITEILKELRTVLNHNINNIHDTREGIRLILK